MIKLSALDAEALAARSIGGHVATDLAADHPDEIRAAVAVNAWDHQEPLYSQGHMVQLQWFHPRVNSEAIGAIQTSLASPTAPEAYKQETGWVYASNGPGVYKADNEYFLYEHDLRENGHLIDTTKTPLYIVEAEYDVSVGFPEVGGAAIARRIPGAEYRYLRHVGHFPTAEDPAVFHAAILPVLDEVLASAGG